MDKTGLHYVNTMDKKHGPACFMCIWAIDMASYVASHVALASYACHRDILCGKQSVTWHPAWHWLPCHIMDKLGLQYIHITDKSMCVWIKHINAPDLTSHSEQTDLYAFSYRNRIVLRKVKLFETKPNISSNPKP